MRTLTTTSAGPTENEPGDADKTANRLAKAIQKIENVAGPFRQQAVTRALGRTVKFVGTARLKVEELSAERAIVSVANKKRVQNHDESGIEPIRCEMI